jgi:hypothetical protein
MLKTLEEDFARIPALLSGTAEAPAPAPQPQAQVIQFPVAPLVAPAAPPDEQLGLF